MRYVFPGPSLHGHVSPAAPCFKFFVSTVDGGEYRERSKCSKKAKMTRTFFYLGPMRTIFVLQKVQERRISGSRLNDTRTAGGAPAHHPRHDRGSTGHPAHWAVLRRAVLHGTTISEPGRKGEGRHGAPSGWMRGAETCRQPIPRRLGPQTPLGVQANHRRLVLRYSTTAPADFFLSCHARSTGWRERQTSEANDGWFCGIRLSVVSWLVDFFGSLLLGG